MKLFLDANVVFSAAHREEGRAQELIALAAANRCTVVTSHHALEEARRNLEVKSRGFEKRLARLLERMVMVGEAPSALVEWALSEGLPLQDASVLAAAVHAGADLLVTGDARDFGPFYDRVLRGAKVITPKRALDIVLKDAGA
ncbi:MAG: putative toxin-antitoxin system toxin component, PIN family [Betaproteobacteria bacterium]|nr:putative toxin-antitoxin system toxin component, PIN family [Betaproteobacteria bacterium]